MNYIRTIFLYRLQKRLLQNSDLKNYIKFIFKKNSFKIANEANKVLF